MCLRYILKKIFPSILEVKIGLIWAGLVIMVYSITFSQAAKQTKSLGLLCKLFRYLHLYYCL